MLNTTDTTAPLPAPRTVASASTRLVPIAWITTLLVSRLPEIILRDVFALSVPWMPWAVLALTVLLWVASRLILTVRPLERYFAVMSALAVLFAVIPLIFASPAWASLVPANGHPIVILLAERLVLVLLALLMVGVVWVLGSSTARCLPARRRPERPDHIAEAGQQRPPALGRVRPADAALPGVHHGMGGRTDVARDDRRRRRSAVPRPGVDRRAVQRLLGGGGLSRRSSVPLQRAIGPGAGVLILAVWFGLGHYYGGIPSGPMGALLTGAVALLFGRAMIETRGLGWPLALHFVGDLVIYAFLALAATTAVS